MATQPDGGKVAGLILAAGTSSRLGRPKQLLDILGEPLIHRVVRTACSSELASVTVILGNQADVIGPLLADLPCEVVVNPMFADGQSTSFLAGLNALPEDATAVLVLLGDQPTILSRTINLMIETWSRTAAPIVQASYRGARSHPVLFNRSLFPELANATGDSGANGVVRSHRNEIVLAEVDEDVPIDIDTAEDYERVLSLLSACQAK